MMRLLAKTSFDGGKGIQLIPIAVTANLPGTGADWFGPARRPDQSESFMLVKGNSGFGIELLDELTIRKSASGTEAKRLKRQIDKQILFHQVHCSDRVRTPKVFRTSDISSTFHADMEFVAAKDFVQFLSEADRGALDDFIQVITDFVSANLALSEDKEVSGEIRRKLAELKTKGVPSGYIEVAERWCDKPVHIPVGTCHGDLTLSNILFKGKELYLLDFLDCYVESPIQDIVKLRQDTQFGWSLQLYQAEFNWPRVQIALRYLDERIAGTFRVHKWYQSHYELFQFVSLMRVLPYCTETKTRNVIAAALDAIVKEG